MITIVLRHSALIRILNALARRNDRGSARIFRKMGWLMGIDQHSPRVNKNNDLHDA